MPCLLAFLTGCGEHVNNTRLPAYPVDINLATPGLWNTYGIGGQGQYRYFIKNVEPAGFAWLEHTYTGFGGVLLVGVDPSAFMQNETWPYMPMAFDMACPVEAEADVRVYVDEATFEAVCPVCHSHYTLYAGGGPVSGPAVGYRYGLETYRCVGSPSAGFHIYR